MRRSETLPIVDLLKVVLNSEKLRDGLDTVRAKNLWIELCGDHIAKSTEDIQIKNNIMIVKINSSLIRNEIILIESEIIKRINSKLGRKFIIDIIVR